MKFKLFIIGVLSVFLMFGCLPQQIVNPQDPIVVKLKIEGVDTVKVEPESDKVVRSMEVKNPSGEYSGMTFIENGVGYVKIWSSLSNVDSLLLWNDLQLMELRGIKNVEVYMNSHGGSSFAGLSIADQIEGFIKRGGVVNAHASGIIASATVPIFAVCSKRTATPGTIFMVHPGKLFKYFADETKQDLEAQTKLMNLLEDSYLGKLEKYTKLSSETWRAKETEITWFCAEKAKEWGLVDEID